MVSLQIFDRYFLNNAFREGFTLYPILLRPKSRGNIRLRSADPEDYPVISPNYLTHFDDLKTLVEGKNTCCIFKKVLDNVMWSTLFTL